MYSIPRPGPFEAVTEHQLDYVVECAGILRNKIHRDAELVSRFSGRRCGESGEAGFEPEEEPELLSETPDRRRDEELDPESD